MSAPITETMVTVATTVPKAVETELERSAKAKSWSKAKVMRVVLCEWAALRNRREQEFRANVEAKP